MMMMMACMLIICVEYTCDGKDCIAISWDEMSRTEAESFCKGINQLRALPIIILAVVAATTTSCLSPYSAAFCFDGRGRGIKQGRRAEGPCFCVYGVQNKSAEYCIL